MQSDDYKKGKNKVQDMINNLKESQSEIEKIKGLYKDISLEKK